MTIDLLSPFDGSLDLVLSQKNYPGRMWDGKYFAPKFSFDIETEMIRDEAHTPRPVLASAFDGTRLVWILPEDLFNFLCLHIESKWIFHNGAFDFSVLLAIYKEAVFRILKNDLAFDSWILARLIALAKTGSPENSKGRFTLGTLAKEKLGVELPKEIECNGVAVRTSYERFLQKPELMPKIYYYYNALDTIATYFLWEVLEDEARGICKAHNVDSEKLLSHHVQMKAAIAATLTTKRGMTLDKNLVEKNIDFLTKANEEAKRCLVDSGFYTGKGRDKRFEGICASIEDESGEAFVRVTNKKGKECVSRKKSDLGKLSHIPFVSSYLTQEKTNKFLKTFVRDLQGKNSVHPRSDILKKTGRTSMFSPNLQQIPRSATLVDLRAQFIARPGHTFLIADYTGAELSTLGQTVLDRYEFSKLADAINAKKDVHKILASAIFRKPESEITKENRMLAKVANFGLAGGLSPQAFVRHAESYGLKITDQEAREVSRAWLETFPEMKKFLVEHDIIFGKRISAHKLYPGSPPSIANNIARGILRGNRTTKALRPFNEHEISFAKNIHEELQKIDTLCPKEFGDELGDYFATLLPAVIPRSGRIRGRCDKNAFLNNAFQGLLSDVAKTAWFELWRQGLPTVHFVHDELVVEVPDEDLEASEILMTQIMEDAGRLFCPDVRLGIEVTRSKFWAK